MIRTAFAVLALAATASACDTAEKLAYDKAHTCNHDGQGGICRPGFNSTSGSGPLTLLPQDAGDESPACLDGSPYGFYFTPSKSGSTKWTISIEGGGESATR